MKRRTQSEKKRLSVLDPRISSTVERGFLYGMQYRLTMNTNALFVVNHIAVVNEQAVFFLLVFSGCYISAVQLIRHISPSHRRIVSGLETLASASLILAPAMLGVMILVPWISYGNPLLWPNLGNILYAGLYAVFLGYTEVFIWNTRHFRSLAKHLGHFGKRETEFKTRHLWRSIPVGSIFERILSFIPPRESRL